MTTFTPPPSRKKLGRDTRQPLGYASMRQAGGSGQAGRAGEQVVQRRLDDQKEAR